MDFIISKRVPRRPVNSNGSRLSAGSEHEGIPVIACGCLFAMYNEPESHHLWLTGAAEPHGSAAEGESGLLWVPLAPKKEKESWLHCFSWRPDFLRVPFGCTTMGPGAWAFSPVVVRKAWLVSTTYLIIIFLGGAGPAD